MPTGSRGRSGWRPSRKASWSRRDFATENAAARRNFGGSRRLQPGVALRSRSRMPVRRLVLLLTAALVLGPAAAAHAAWNVAQPIDGPNADVIGMGSVDLARDGTGAVTYLRNDGGVPHVFVSRLFGGVWQSPVRVDPGLGAATEAKVAVGDGNRIAVVWVADGSVFAASTAVSATPAPFSAPVPLGGPGAH